MKKIKSLAAVFLALFILAAIPTQAFAAETHEGVATMHTHQWRLDHYDSKSTCNCLATRAAVTSAFSFSVLFIACCAATARERMRAGEMYGYADR